MSEENKNTANEQEETEKDIPETETVVSVIAVGKAAESPARPPRKELDVIAKFF